MTKQLLVMAVLAWGGAAVAAPALDGAKIDQLTGAKGKLDAKEGTRRR